MKRNIFTEFNADKRQRISDVLSRKQYSIQEVLKRKHGSLQVPESESIKVRRVKSIVIDDLEDLISNISNINIHVCDGPASVRQYAQYTVVINITDRKTITFVYDEMIGGGCYRYFILDNGKYNGLWTESWLYDVEDNIINCEIKLG